MPQIQNLRRHSLLGWCRCPRGHTYLTLLPALLSPQSFFLFFVFVQILKFPCRWQNLRLTPSSVSLCSSDHLSEVCCAGLTVSECFLESHLSYSILCQTHLQYTLCLLFLVTVFLFPWQRYSYSLLLSSSFHPVKQAGVGGLASFLLFVFFFPPNQSEMFVFDISLILKSWASPTRHL